MSKENVDVVLALEKAWDSNDLDGIEKFYTDDFLSHTSTPGLSPTVETFKMVHQMSLGAMPDRKVEVLDAIDGGDKVVLRQLMTGTNNGTGFPWFGVEADGGKIATEWISVYRLEDGRVAEHWAVIDGFTMLGQLGIFNPPPMPG